MGSETDGAEGRAHADSRASACARLSSAGIDLLKRFEGFSSIPYVCPAGYPTIGYGSRTYADGRPVTLDDTPITQEMALTLLRATLVRYERAVEDSSSSPLLLLLRQGCAASVGGRAPMTSINLPTKHSEEWRIAANPSPSAHMPH